MSCKHHTADSEAIALDLPAPQVTILQRTLTSCLEGVRGDLRAPEQLPEPEKARRDADAYERLLAGLDRGEMFVPDEAAFSALEAIATAADEENNYEEVVAEHVALYELLARLGVEAR